MSNLQSINQNILRKATNGIFSKNSLNTSIMENYFLSSDLNIFYIENDNVSNTLWPYIYDMVNIMDITIESMVDNESIINNEKINIRKAYDCIPFKLRNI